MLGLLLLYDRNIGYGLVCEGHREHDVAVITLSGAGECAGRKSNCFGFRLFSAGQCQRLAQSFLDGSACDRGTRNDGDLLRLGVNNCFGECFDGFPTYVWRLQVPDDGNLGDIFGIDGYCHRHISAKAFCGT
ncbi:hypothetical protein SDC9_94287 [bioreactor metagenome]|uniref:Uncharacterized protein n=1 Tax=bioreactor metagenome TaxID=1076179 RepID=A0A645A3R1_9ZZZZ